MVTKLKEWDPDAFELEKLHGALSVTAPEGYTVMSGGYIPHAVHNSANAINSGAPVLAPGLLPGMRYSRPWTDPNSGNTVGWECGVSTPSSTLPDFSCYVRACRLKGSPTKPVQNQKEVEEEPKRGTDDSLVCKVVHGAPGRDPNYTLKPTHIYTRPNS